MSMFKSNAVVVDTCNLRLTALKKHLSAKTQVSINGVHYSVAQLIAAYQACLDTRASLLEAHGIVKKAIAERDAAEAERAAIEQGLKVWIIGQFGATSSVAHEFGYGPKKQGAKTLETKVLAVTRAKATRKARHTMGKKQKQDVKGTKVVLAEPPAAVSIDGASHEATSNGAHAPPLNGSAQPN